MRLEDLEKELYQQKESVKPDKTQPQPASPSTPGWQTFPQEPEAPEPTVKKSFALPKLRLPRRTWLFASTGVLLVSVGFILWWWFFSFPASRVVLAITGPEEVRIGERQEILIKYENKTRSPLTEARLILSLPEGVSVSGDPGLRRIERDLGTVGIDGRGEEKIALRFTGETGKSIELKPSIVFRPQNISAKLEKSSSLNVHLGPAFLKVEISAPNEALSEEKFWTTVRYENIGEETAENVRLRLSLPQSFRITKVVPSRFNAGADWNLGELSPDEKGEITIEGILTGGKEREQNSFTAELGLSERGSFLNISKSSANVSIAASPLPISATVNNATALSIRPADDLIFKILYKNSTAVALREIVIKAELAGDMFDFSSLKAGGAYFDSGTQTLTWHGGNTPGLLTLNPNEGGEITFEIKVLPTYRLTSGQKKELTLKMKASISTSSIPPTLGVRELANETEINMPVVSNVMLRARITFEGGASPMKVGSESIFRVNWEAITFSNDIKEVKVRTILPEGVNWAGDVSGNFAEFNAAPPEYNERTQEITWAIPLLPAGSGVSITAPNTSFSIKARPSSQYINRTVPLLGAVEIEGQDSFANVRVASQTQPINSSLPDDRNWNPKNGEVRP